MAELVIKLVNGELAGKTMQSINKELRDAKLNADKATAGTQSWVDAHKKLEDAKKLQSDLKKQIEGTTDASTMLKNAWNKLPGAQYFNQVSQSFGMMKSGVGGLVSQFGVLKTAIAATGIGLLVVAVATLVGWFKKTDEGATLLSGIMRGLGIVMDMVFGKMIDGFKYISGFFNGEKSIKQGLQDLVDFIGNNLLNRLKAFVVIAQGIFELDFKKTADGFIQLGTGVEHATDKLIAFGQSVIDAGKEGVVLEKQLDAIADRARELGVMNAQTKKDVDQLMLQSKNVGLTYEQRIALLDKASGMEIKNHAAQLANARELEKVRAKEIEDNAKRNIQTDELDQALADATTARIALENESINLQEKIANRRTALVEKQTAEIQKAAEDEKKINDNIAELKVQAMAEGLAKEIAAIENDTLVKMAAIQGSETQIIEQRNLLKDIELSSIAALEKKYADEAAEDDVKRKADQEKRDKEAADKAMKIAADEAKFKRAVADAQLEFASFAFGATADLLGEDEKARKENAEAIKAFTIAQIIADTEREISGYFANPASTASLGVVGTLKSIGALIRAGLSIRKVSNQKFKFGGIPDGVLRGPSHANGGIPLEAEGREIILTKGVFENSGLRAAASAINVAGGGRSFALGGAPINPFNDQSRGPVSSGRAGAPLTDPLGISDLKEAFLAYAEATNARVDRIKVVNNLQDTRDGLKVIDEIVKDWNA